MNPRFKKILIWVGYPVFYLFCFLIFAYFTFPFEHLRDRIIVEFTADQRKSGGNMRLEIESLTSYWLSGIEARGVRLISPPPPPTADGVRKPATEIGIERLTARFSILPLLIGRTTLNVSAKTMGGLIEASTTKKGEDRQLEADIEKVSVAGITPLVEAVGLPINGELKGHLDITLPEGKLAKANGTIRLMFVDYSVGDGKAKIKDMIALPKMNVGDLTLECDIKDGVAKVSKLAASGQDLDFSSDGKLTLRDPFSDSQADLYMRFKFADGYKNRNDTTRNLFGAPGSNVPPAIEMVPAMKSSKRADGFYSWHVWGLLKMLRYDPSPTGAGPSASPNAGPIRGGFKP
ncbi:MAG: type II secretion system protein GspN [Deltaproteobacteria bacterium]|nr:type II secretion system protein GspN [Deltaproteobacteria bacterium]